MLRLTAKLARTGYLLLLAASPALAQDASAPPPQPIPGASPWLLLPDMVGKGQCSVRMNGDIVDVMLVINKDQKMLLIAGRKDWAFQKATPADFTLQIDAGPALPMQGDGVANLFLTQPDDETSARIIKANDLTWRLPWGEFHARVAGMDKAFEALKACVGGS